MKTILISLVSDQTIPNVQLIKELKGQVTDFLFISTNGMEKKGCRNWIEDATNIKGLPPIIVEQFSFDDIVAKLDQFDFEQYEKKIVNLTGGTKVMTVAAHDYFKEEGAEILYITGDDNKYLRIFPGKKKVQFTFATKITVIDYLKAYGFEIDKSKPSGISYEYTCKMFAMYCEGIFYNHYEALNLLRGFRNKGLKEKEWVKYPQLHNFLNAIDFTPEKNRSLSSQEVKYLTGEWFEEYIGYGIKNEFGLSDEELMISAVLRKNLGNENNNYSLVDLLGEEALKVATYPDNEIDVMFIFNGKFYTIECKTSIIDIREITEVKNEEVKTKLKEVNILGETIYKVDSLKNKFGLFAKSYIFTLTGFPDYINQDDRVLANNRIKQMVDLFNRASLSRITVADKEQIRNSCSFYELIS